MAEMNRANQDMTASDGSADSPPSVTRRAVVGTTLGVFGAGYAGAIGYPIYAYLNTPVVRAATASAVTEVALPGAQATQRGTAMAFMFGIRPALLIHNQNGKWYSFDAVCTHLGCTVKFEGDKDRIHCACHGGVYDPTTGQPVSGPPPRALTQYNVEVKDDEVVVSRA